MIWSFGQFVFGLVISLGGGGSFEFLLKPKETNEYIIREFENTYYSLGITCVCLLVCAFLFQLVLCFGAKTKLVNLLPVIFLALETIGVFVCLIIGHDIALGEKYIDMGDFYGFFLSAIAFMASDGIGIALARALHYPFRRAKKTKCAE